MHLISISPYTLDLLEIFEQKPLREEVFQQPNGQLGILLRPSTYDRLTSHAQGSETPGETLERILHLAYTRRLN